MRDVIHDLLTESWRGSGQTKGAALLCLDLVHLPALIDSKDKNLVNAE